MTFSRLKAIAVILNPLERYNMHASPDLVVVLHDFDLVVTPRVRRPKEATTKVEATRMDIHTLEHHDRIAFS